MSKPSDPAPSGTAIGTGDGAPPDPQDRLVWRPLRAEHRRQVREILAESKRFRPDEVDVALEVFDDHIASPEDYRALAVFQPARRLLGFTFYGPTPCTVGTWDLYWIAVRPHAQRSGIGRALLERTEARMRDDGGRLSVIETSSREEYDPTRRFYLACGYQETARVPDFYDQGDDLVIYTRRLDWPRNGRSATARA